MIGTSLISYMRWLEIELAKKTIGKVSLTFEVYEGQIVKICKESTEEERFRLDKK